MSYYDAKFKREAKDRPQDWIIKSGRGGYKLIHIGAAK